jgi:hypothetical protein
LGSLASSYPLQSVSGRHIPADSEKVTIYDLILHFHDSSQENCPFSATAEYI